MGVRLKATFAYDAENPDELSFREGDIILLKSKVDEGWWEGDLNGTQGLFPSNFVEEVEDQAPPPAAAASVNSRISSQPNLPIPKMGRPPSIGNKADKKKAKVLFDYDAENPDELTLRVGEVVDILKQEDEGWWEGRLNGNSGVFPSNFVELIPGGGGGMNGDSGESTEIKAKKVMPPSGGIGDLFHGGVPQLKKTSVHSKVEDAPAAPTPAAASRPEKRVSDKKRGKMYNCIFDYEPENDDELCLRVGDKVCVLKQEDEGWWEGEANGVHGLFPSNFVEPLPELEPKRAPPSIPRKNSTGNVATTTSSSVKVPKMPTSARSSVERTSPTADNAAKDELAAKFAHLKTAEKVSKQEEQEKQEAPPKKVPVVPVVPLKKSAEGSTESLSKKKPPPAAKPKPKAPTRAVDDELQKKFAHMSKKETEEKPSPQLAHKTRDRPKKAGGARPPSTRLNRSSDNSPVDKSSIEVSDDYKEEFRKLIFEFQLFKKNTTKEIEDLKKELAALKQ